MLNRNKLLLWEFAIKSGKYANVLKKFTPKAPRLFHKQNRTGISYNSHAKCPEIQPLLQNKAHSKILLCSKAKRRSLRLVFHLTEQTKNKKINSFKLSPAVI